MTLTTETAKVLAALRAHVESYDHPGWGMVYLDNAAADLVGMSAKSFRAHLAVLSQADLYRVVDGFAWGEVAK